MDALSQVLDAVRLTSGIFLEAEFSAPWCVDTNPADSEIARRLSASEQVCIFHLVTEGRCQVRLAEGSERIELQAGDLIMFPHGHAHVLGTDVGTRPAPFREMVRPGPQGGLLQVNEGGGGARTRFLCGFVAGDRRTCRPLLGTLPRMVSVSLRDSPASSWIEATLRRAAAETQTPSAGGNAVLARLAELAFVEAIREYARSLPASQQGWLAGVRDPHVGRALALLHADPARNWEVETLAKEAGISRSALADRFVALLGEPPMQYLTGWRMALASRALSTTNDAVARIAERVGYESEAAFNRAFKREFGSPPAAWRRAARKARVPA